MLLVLETSECRLKEFVREVTKRPRLLQRGKLGLLVSQGINTARDREACHRCHLPCVGQRDRRDRAESHFAQAAVAAVAIEEQPRPATILELQIQTAAVGVTTRCLKSLDRASG